MRHASLFSGIGGFDLAAQWAGFENVFQVEIDPFCNKVLEKNFSNVKRYRDIKEFDGEEYEGQINIVSGGFPCQPFSAAGRRRGKNDDRYLWPEMLRVLSEIRPTWIVGENVAGLINMAQPDCESDMESETDNCGEEKSEEQSAGLLMGIIADLEGIGYDVQPFVIPACALNAPHRRDRVWIVAHSRQQRKVLQESRFSYGQQSGEEKKKRSISGDGFTNEDSHAPDPCDQGLQGSKRAGTHDEPERPHMDQLPNVVTHGTNHGSPLRLEPAFVVWMMGFPPGWLDLKDGG